MEEEMDEGGYATWDNFIAKWNEHLSRCLSPLRIADIGGMCTLFRWGDILSGVVEEIYSVGTVGNTEGNGILEQPNMVGIFIASILIKMKLLIIYRTQRVGMADVPLWW